MWKPFLVGARGGFSFNKTVPTWHANPMRVDHGMDCIYMGIWCPNCYIPGKWWYYRLSGHSRDRSRWYRRICRHLHCRNDGKTPSRRRTFCKQRSDASAGSRRRRSQQLLRLNKISLLHLLHFYIQNNVWPFWGPENCWQNNLLPLHFAWIRIHDLKQYGPIHGREKNESCIVDGLYYMQLFWLKALCMPHPKKIDIIHITLDFSNAVLDRYIHCIPIPQLDRLDYR